MERKRLKSVLIFLAAILATCSQQMKFEKEKWHEKNDINFAYREKMVNDLMANHLKKGMTYNEVMCLLGKSDNYQNKKPNTITYEIMVDYGRNIDPQKIKTLSIEYTNDSIVKNIKLIELKH